MDVIIGAGVVGSALRKLLEENNVEVCGYDLDPDRSFNVQGFNQYYELLHVCIPYTENFIEEVLNVVSFLEPKAMVIHSTVEPWTTYDIMKATKMHDVFYSPIRGHHSKMLDDIKHYTKFYAYYLDADENLFLKRFKDQCKLKVRKYRDPVTLEVAKVASTDYYGLMIAFGQLVDKVCCAMGLDYDEVWEFQEEIPNRWKPYVDPKGIQGHCVLPNLDLLKKWLPELKEFVIKVSDETEKRYKKA